MRENRRNTPRHIDWSQVPNEDRFQRFASSRKRLLDTAKLIAYRAETAMMITGREVLSEEVGARSLLRDLFRINADITREIADNVVRVSVHGMANPGSNVAIRNLVDALNAAEFTLLETPFQPTVEAT